MCAARIAPVGTNTSSHGYDALDPETYTAHRLKHASPEHLHLTTRRFFIGPIPEGWLNSNRKSWYKRRLELSTYSSRRATFTASNAEAHQRALTGFGGPSTAARMNFSFPQPEDVGDDVSGAESPEIEDEAEDTDGEFETRFLSPTATHEIPQILGIADKDDPTMAKTIPVPLDRGLGPIEQGRLSPDTLRRTGKSPGQDTFFTAKSQPTRDSRYATPRESEDTAESTNPDQGPGRDQYDGAFKRHSASNTGESFLQHGSYEGSSFPDEGSSETRLIEPSSSKARDMPAMPLNQNAPTPFEGDDSYTPLGRTHTGVRFKMVEGVMSRERRVAKRVDSTRERVAKKGRRRSTLKEGTIVKMEKMLVRVDLTTQEVPNDYDENGSMKVETRAIEKWREFMVVARKSKNEDADDFRLQMWKTRVIPEIDNDSTKKKPAREVRLIPRSTRVNMYSSLDKTVVMWHPYRKGTRIIIMRPRSEAHAVEWYTFLRDSLGSKRTDTLQVRVPDLAVNLLLEKPFEGLEAAGVAAPDEETAMARTVAAEQAVAGRIITQCTEMLESNPEWSSVLEHWTDTSKMGLAWKRYDRLEWVHGVNEQKMYGSMAMQQSHDLELRPKQHYPTITFGHKGVKHEEPAPVEGFLIRLTSQKGVHARLGKTFYKRLYFSTQNQFLLFNRPAKVTPPHPPRLATINGRNVPSSHEIVEKSPHMYEITPFTLNEAKTDISWLSSGNPEHVSRHDRDAFEEARRNMANLTACDGYVNMTRIIKVRTIKWGANPADEEMDSGSDVDFHQEVADTLQEDGATKTIDDDRVFELLLDNGLVIRLQSYDKETRDQWMTRLKQLVKYWKLRTTADMSLFKSVRRSNLQALKIDEEMEAVIGQFGRKWEVTLSEASPQLYHMCGISCCRPISLSGLLYRKPRRHSTFQRCGVILAGGQLLIFQASLRTRTGEQVRHIHSEKTEVIDLKECYVYSGLITEDDLLYQNRTFDSNSGNHVGARALPRVYQEDGWTSQDEDCMTCFVVWRAVRRGWFRSTTTAATGGNTGDGAGSGKRMSIASAMSGASGTRGRLRRVAQLGVPGRGIVFKCRSRAERDHWVLGVASEIERVVEGEDSEVRFAS